jgi:hypothetical protein
MKILGKYREFCEVVKYCWQINLVLTGTNLAQSFRELVDNIKIKTFLLASEWNLRSLKR